MNDLLIMYLASIFCLTLIGLVAILYGYTESLKKVIDALSGWRRDFTKMARSQANKIDSNEE